MQLLANRRVRIETDIVTRIRRVLSGAAVFMAQVNQEVSPHDIIGTSEVTSGYRNINLASELNVSVGSVKEYLQKSVGQTIYKGELIAIKPAGLLSEQMVVVSPSDSVIDFLDEKTGNLRLNFQHKKESVPAAVFGVVEKVDTETGVVIIRTQVTKIHGVSGGGKLRDGVLRSVGERADLLTGETINPSFADSIIVGGGLIYKDGIHKSVASNVSGIITGGINLKDYLSFSGGKMKPEQMATDIGVSVMICEGFGSIPIGIDIYNKLEQNFGRYAILDGSRSELILPTYNLNAMMKIRATHLPDEVGGNVVGAGNELEAIDLQVGQAVRVIGSNYIGDQGKVLAIDQTLTTLPSGIRTYMLTVETRSRKIRVPYTNVEIID